MKIGVGYDIHAFAEDRPLILGGVQIPFDRGLTGHSDADVLVHAVCDALLGAAGMGDIGEHFPETDPQYKNADSLNLLKAVWQIIYSHHQAIINMDATLFAQAPRLSPYKAAMREQLAAALNIPVDRINIKATTTEGLGFIGRGEGIAAMCVALID